MCFFKSLGEKSNITEQSFKLGKEESNTLKVITADVGGTFMDLVFYDDGTVPLRNERIRYLAGNGESDIKFRR